MRSAGPEYKTMVKLVWTLAGLVLILGLVKAAMVYERSHETDRDIVIRNAK